MKTKKLILVTASYDQLRGKIRKILSEIASEKKLELDIKEEDWNFLIKYGKRDEIGGFDLPQVFIEYDNGKIEHVLTRIPLTDQGKLDLDRAKKLILRRIS